MIQHNAGMMRMRRYVRERGLRAEHGVRYMAFVGRIGRVGHYSIRCVKTWRSPGTNWSYRKMPLSRTEQKR